MSASSVLPPAMRTDVQSEPKVVALASNAPTAIAGHRALPHNSRLGREPINCCAAKVLVGFWG